MKKKLSCRNFQFQVSTVNCTNIIEYSERDNTEVEKFFSGMTEEEKKDNKNLRCKMAKEIFKREALSKKVTMLELGKQD